MANKISNKTAKKIQRLGQLYQKKRTSIARDWKQIAEFCIQGAKRQPNDG